MIKNAYAKQNLNTLKQQYTTKDTTHKHSYETTNVIMCGYI